MYGSPFIISIVCVGSIHDNWNGLGINNRGAKKIGGSIPFLVGIGIGLTVWYQWSFFWGAASALVTSALLVFVSPKTKQSGPEVYLKPDYWLEDEPTQWKEKTDIEAENLNGNVSSVRLIQFENYEGGIRRQIHEIKTTYDRPFGTKGDKHIFTDRKSSKEVFRIYSYVNFTVFAEKLDKGSVGIPENRSKYLRVEENCCHLGEIDKRILITYNYSGRVSELKEYTVLPNDRASIITTNKWHNNFLIERIRSDGELVTVNKFRYDAKGNLGEEIVSDRGVSSGYSLKYDNLIRGRFNHLVQKWFMG